MKDLTPPKRQELEHELSVVAIDPLKQKRVQMDIEAEYPGAVTFARSLLFCPTKCTRHDFGYSIAMNMIHAMHVANRISHIADIDPAHYALLLEQQKEMSDIELQAGYEGMASHYPVIQKIIETETSEITKFLNLPEDQEEHVYQVLYLTFFKFMRLLEIANNKPIGIEIQTKPEEPPLENHEP